MKIKDLPKSDRPREKMRSERRCDKVEMYWGSVHDVINTKTRRCVATLWTKDAARNEGDYFPEYVGVDLDALEFRRGSIHAKKAKDGVLDVVVNVKKFNRRIFDRVLVRSLDVADVPSPFRRGRG